MTTITSKAYQRLLEEDVAWLLAQPMTCERTHIEAVLKAEILAIAPPIPRKGNP